MKRRIVKLFLILTCFTIILGTCYFVLTTANASEYKPNEYNGSIFQNSVKGSYEDAVLNNQEVNKEIRPDEEINIDATKNYQFIDTTFNTEASLFTIDGETGLLIPETGEITYSVNVSAAGFYNIKLRYYSVKGRNSNICRGIKINDEYQFAEAESFTLYRYWVDEFDVASKRDEKNHDLKPSQVEKNQWNTQTIRDTEGYYTASYLFSFIQGENTITFTSVQEPVVLETITLFNDKAVKSYQEVLSDYLEKGYQKQSENNIEEKIQAETSFEKSSPSLCPVANYSSFKVEPYKKFLTRYNTIGGENWDIAGDWISWELTVEKAGLYHITMKALQNYNHGKESSRILYINDEIPFEECKSISVNYDSDWQNITFGDKTNGDYWFYLKEGKNYLKLENTIGKYGTTVLNINEVIADLNWIYRKVIMRTGVNPSKYHDFNLRENIPELYDKINDSIKKLDDAINTIVDISGERSDLIASLERTKYQLESFNESEKKIQTGLGELENNITALGTWIATVTSQPLLIDYILVHGDNTKLPKATTNFFQKLGNEFILLIGSYRADTSLKSSLSVDGPTIEVWIMTGRDQSNLLRQLIDESFTVQHNINVKLKLVSSTVLLPATLSGNGPDVAIGVAQNIPVNWGIRNAVVDISQFADFEEYSKNFYDSAITPFTFNGKTYSLPDTQDFLIQFVRTDIFEEFGLVNEDGTAKTPDNWNEVIDLLPILQRQYLDYYLPNVTGALSPLMFSMIEQYGGKLYLDNGARTGIMEENAANAFYDFVNFYNNYGFAVDANFTNRFRTGEMPIGVTNYTLYNTLAVSAPEIRGNWTFASLPGKLNDDNTTTYASTSTATGTIILSSSKEINASWEFMKWWLGAEAQEGYARGIEAILGAAARYPTANKTAFANLPWSASDYRILESQRACAVGVPTVPGDYIVGRYIDNAFRKVINDNINPSDSLFTYYQKINAELSRKRKEFNLE